MTADAPPARKIEPATNMATPGRQCALYAHLDSSGEGGVAPGDLISTTRIAIVADPTNDDMCVEILLHTVA